MTRSSNSNKVLTEKASSRLVCPDKPTRFRVVLVATCLYSGVICILQGYALVSLMGLWYVGTSPQPRVSLKHLAGGSLGENASELIIEPSP